MIKETSSHKPGRFCEDEYSNLIFGLNITAIVISENVKQIFRVFEKNCDDESVIKSTNSHTSI